MSRLSRPAPILLAFLATAVAVFLFLRHRVRHSPAAAGTLALLAVWAMIHV